MPLNADRILKPVRQVRKLLKKMPKRPSPDEVHRLRTNTRRLEATLEAFSLDSRRNVRRLLKDLSRLRKRAGKVRDMDVLTAYASQVHPDGEQDCIVQLLEFLGAKREKRAKQLYAAVGQYGPTVRKRLKRGSGQFKKILSGNNKTASDGNAAADVAGSALSLSTELTRPARLGRANLHPYRLKVKELRTVLRMSDSADRQDFVDALGEVKDAIGEWHDWVELSSIANEVLDHGQRSELLRAVKETSDAKYQHALALTNSMRKKYLRVPNGKGKGISHVRIRRPAQPVLSAAAALAA